MFTPDNFTEQHTGDVFVDSTWIRHPSTRTAAVQTSRIRVRAVETQTSASALRTGGSVSHQLDKAVETDRTQSGHARPPQAILQGVQYVYSNTSYDVEALAVFLEQCHDGLRAVLERNTQSSVLDSYEPNWSAQSSEITLQHLLGGTAEMPDSVTPLGMDWSAGVTAGGSLFAACYGQRYNSGWCTETGYVHVWNVSRLGSVGSSNKNSGTSTLGVGGICVNAPHYSLKTRSCATCLAFHPTLTNTLAVGMCNGEVLVYPQCTDATPHVWPTTETTSSTNSSPSSSAASLWTHAEMVTALQWVQSPHEVRASYRYVLLSASLDGVLAYWTPVNRLSAPVALYEVLDRRHRSVAVFSASYSYNSGDTFSASSAGATAKEEAARRRWGSGVRGRDVSVPTMDGSLFVGLVTGDVGRGRTGFINIDAALTSSASVKPSDAKASIPNPTPLKLDWLKRHNGAVHSIGASPFFRHLLLSCSNDDGAHVYNDMEQESQLTLNPAVGARDGMHAGQFSPFRPGVVALVSQAAVLHLYDLQRSSTAPVCSVDAGTQGSAVTGVRFNRASASEVATCDSRAAIRVWRLPNSLTRMTDLERAAVRASHTGASTTMAAVGAAEDREVGDAGTSKSVVSGSDAIRRLFGFAL